MRRQTLHTVNRKSCLFRLRRVYRWVCVGGVVSAGVGAVIVMLMGRLVGVLLLMLLVWGLDMVLGGEVEGGERKWWLGCAGLLGVVSFGDEMQRAW